ncbi:protein-disulfide reductase DsbD family protein [Xanthomonas translucens]|uniref:protein-disulfide reductase DsbD family protein n=3 Tax=Xanthomonas campestris pv. translucens TaxID=343 RepID=UPI0012968A02|nr:protein-disulfide reductase DsbD [Xanthomonas translucens]MCS3361582.1 protein-disulfide reductase DsbD [Xanthomonas translucens pv. translucens]MCS3374567.1 protein-disulfide reductase DsbD [Xanthomonas translucens pv. translucens]MCT8291171.1 protein-disulfide reductase DsbD [Xanthomonas translucens pv. translucens]MCT8294016.1 protein-disulfide reductase DsbD [Xanthomonas translucens pv. translucens]MCT8314159.1 protein-disulfide reductase DsbD [Xanthomonas translucens pv. translucens]
MTVLHRIAALCLLALAACPALAVDEKDLLPVDQAFVLTAQAPERGRIELHWKITEGYYLYRHRIAVRVLDGFKPNPTLQLPAGHKKTDPYFGEVETYRGALNAVQSGVADPATTSVQVEVRYQGCADAGVCYPPQKRVLKVALPAAEAGAAAPSPLPGSAPGAAGPAAKPLFGGGGAVQGLPLPSDQAFGFEAIVGDGNTLLLRFTPAPGYYLYRDRTALALEGAAGIRTGLPRWPQGRTHQDEHFGNVVVYFNQTEVSVPLQRQRADAAEATLVATFQGCQTEGICYPPMTRRVKLSLPKGKLSPADQAEVAPLLVTPLNSSQADANVAAADTAAPATAPDAASAPDASAHNAARSTAPVAEPQSLLWMLLLALGGGLVLNLLPCVLPILSLKVLGVAQSGESRSRARRHALWYTLGVLVSFAVVGGIAVAARLLWGFQLQRPGFVAVLVYLMFVVGLSLSGVFTLSANLGGLGQSLSSRSGPVGDFFTGVLACVVSSACIGPFMGPALGYALTAPPAMAMLVFLTLGLGLALPFLLIGFVPSLARRLPKPGAWMETLKQVLAFPMYLTAIWLLWVLGKQRGVDAVALLLVGATLLALGLWWFERARWRGHKTGMRLASVLLLLALVPALGVTRLAPPGATVERNTVAYSPQMLDRLRTDNRVVFVNMTADWCVTCKANERNVFSSDAFRDTLKRVDAVYMKGDWTNEDERISAFLAEHKAVGVPLYVVYGPGAPPTVLPPVLSQAVVEDALLRASR